MKNIWLYTPEICDGDFCPQDCDACPKKELIFERKKMKPKKLIFQCPYFYKCHAPQDMQPIPFLADKIEYEKRAIMCKHPFLRYYNEHICRIEYDDGVDFDYDAAISKIRITRRGRLKRLFKRGK